MQIDSYLRRIGYDGPISPTLPVLQAICRAHPMAIPFENLNPFLGLPVELDISGVEEKLVHNGRGGYCYEHNRLLAEALKLLGFKVSELAARVLWMRSPEDITPRSHMVLLVTAEGISYIVDAGFGGATLTAPLKLVANAEQQTPHEEFRLLNHDDEWESQANIQGQWQSLYRFDLQRQHAEDYKFANYYLSTHTDSHFRKHLIAARPTANGRITLSDRQLSVRTAGGEPVRSILNSPAEIRDVLETRFGLDTSTLPMLENRLAALFDAELR